LELLANFDLASQANHYVTLVIVPDIASQSWLGLLIVHVFVLFDSVWLLIFKLFKVDLSVRVLLALDYLQDIEQILHKDATTLLTLHYKPKLLEQGEVRSSLMGLIWHEAHSLKHRASLVEINQLSLVPLLFLFGHAANSLQELLAEPSCHHLIGLIGIVAVLGTLLFKLLSFLLE
jgi:hypothetical protein